MIEQTLDSEPWKGLAEYTKTMQGVVRSWSTFFEGGFKPEHFPARELRDWTKRLETTFNVLQDQYVYDTLHSVQVHPVASGFPEMSHIRMIESMYQSLKNGKNNAASSISLRRLALDNVFENKRMNLWLLERIAKARACELLTSDEPMWLFKVRGMTEFPSTMGRKVYACCFERFCYRYVPSLYLVLFEYEGESELAGNDLQVFLRVLEEDTSNLPLLGRFAEKLDRAIAPIHPKWVGRISLGPVFIAHMTTDDHLLQQTLNEQTLLGTTAAVSRMIYEYVVSEKVVPVERMFDGDGRKHTELQEFAVRQIDPECTARQVTYVEKHLFAPHRIVQGLSDQFRREIGHTIQLQGDDHERT